MAERERAPGVRRWIAAALVLATGITVFAVVDSRREESEPTRGTPERAADAATQPAAVATPRQAAPAASTPAPESVRGVVVDWHGTPVVAADVVGVHEPTATSRETRTDAAGAFSLLGLPSEPMRLLVRHPEFLRQNVVVPVAGRDSLHLVAHRRPVVRGRVLDARRSLPIARFCAVVLPIEGDALPAPTVPPGPPWLQAADGAFAVVAESTGPHALAVFTEHHCTAFVRLQLEPDAVIERDVHAEPGICVRGIVRDAAGLAVAGAAVTMHPVPMAAGELAASAADGTFALRPVAEGAYGIVVQPVDRPALRRTDLRLLASAPDPFLELQLPAGASVHGTVQPWRPGQSAEVVFAHDDGYVRRATADAATGAFELDELTPGWHTVSVERTEETWRSSVGRQLFDPKAAPRIELAAGRPQRIDPVDPVATMARLRGSVAGHAAPDRLVVRAFREDAAMSERATGMFRAVPAADGRFELDGFLPGRWRLQVMAGNDVLHWEVLTFAAGDDVERVLRVETGR